MPAVEFARIGSGDEYTPYLRDEQEELSPKQRGRKDTDIEKFVRSCTTRKAAF